MFKTNLSSDVLFVGLGNYEAQFLNNRHNVGFMVLDTLGESFGSGFTQSKHKCLLGSFGFNGARVFLCKPQTFMNNSGIAVAAVKNFYKIATRNIYVFYDDLDLPLGSFRIKCGGGSGGHNGLKSLDSHIGTEYNRVRIGIGRPEHKSEVSSYVLSDFSSSEVEVVLAKIEILVKNIDLLLNGRSSVLLEKLKTNLG